MSSLYELSDEEYIDRKRLVDTIRTLSKGEHEEIFRIIKRFDQPYTENSNGIFFDISITGRDALARIKRYMEFCGQNRTNQEERIHIMQELPVKKCVDDNKDK